MTTLPSEPIAVCTFCRDAHQRWGKNHKFNKLKKEKIQSCFLCKKAMCQECVGDSQQELEGTLLGKFGFDICYGCVTTTRRDLALKPRVEQFVLEVINSIREQVKVEIYTLKKEGVGVQ